MANETSHNSALGSLRVLDLTSNVAGPYCSKLLAGFGAQVVKVEPPQGDPLRQRGPFFGGEPDGERSIGFHWFNTGKRSVTLDLKRPDDRVRFKELAAVADVVLEDLGPGGFENLGLGFEVLREVNPALIVTSISNFGQSGPYKDYQADEITLYAMSGLMSATGDGAREPLVSGPAICQLSAGMKAYIATLMACYRRAASGMGDWIDLSMHEVALDNFEIAVAEYLHTGKVARRSNDEHPLVPWRIFPCADGYAAVIGGPIRHWLTAVEMFEEPALLEEKYAHMEGRIKHRDDIRRLMTPWLMRNKKKDIFHEGQRRGLAFGYLATLQDVVEAPQNQARQAFEAVRHPDVGEQKMLGAPFKANATPWRQQRSPRLGEHQDALRELLARWREQKLPGAVTGDSVAGEQPLAGVRIVDLTHDWAGPHAVRMMADYGAEVIKIEYPRRLDGMRGAYLDRLNKHPRWWQINRNKKSITLDLHVPEQVEAFKELVRVSDVVVDNSRPGVMERWGLGYDALREVKPDILVVSMSAWGATGPESSYAGYGGAIEAVSGVQCLTGYSRDGNPMRVREVDVTNGIMGTCAIMTGLLHRRLTGEGQYIDLSEREACAWLIGEHLLEYTATGRQTLPLGNRHPHYAPQGCYPCQGEDRWMVLTIRSDAEWQRFRVAAGNPQWAEDSRFATAEGRRAHHDELDTLISQWSRQRTPAMATSELQAAGLAAGFVATTADIAEDAHLTARGWLQKPARNGGAVYPGFPFRFVNGGGAFWRRGPDLGEDNKEIVQDLLGQPASVLPSLADADLGTAFDLD